MLTVRCDRCGRSDRFDDEKALVDKANRGFWRLRRVFDDEDVVTEETLICATCFMTLQASTSRKCPRCECAVINEFSATALSRTTRDEGAAIEVCTRCGERESLYGREANDQVPFTAWPVLIKDLVKEERHLLTRERASRIELVRLDELDVGKDEQ